MSSPTQRTLDLLRARGYRVAVVERWNPYARIRQDLFGVIDVVALGDGETVGIQCTSGSNVAARVRKIAEAEAARRSAQGWLAAAGARLAQSQRALDGERTGR